MRCDSNWSLYESMKFSDYLSVKLNVWGGSNNKRLEVRLLFNMGGSDAINHRISCWR